MPRRPLRAVGRVIGRSRGPAWTRQAAWVEPVSMGIPTAPLWGAPGAGPRGDVCLPGLAPRGVDKSVSKH